MGEICAGCRKTFVAGDVVVTFNYEQVRLGEKSGLLGFYEHKYSPDGAVDHIHFSYSCIELAFSPADNPYMWDVIAEEIRKEIYEEESNRDAFDLPFEEQEPPYCLWCKREDTVWLHRDRDMHVYWCQGCNKLWDQEEDELAWDPSKHKYVFAVES